MTEDNQEILIKKVKHNLDYGYGNLFIVLSIVNLLISIGTIYKYKVYENFDFSANLFFNGLMLIVGILVIVASRKPYWIKGTMKDLEDKPKEKKE